MGLVEGASEPLVVAEPLGDASSSPPELASSIPATKASTTAPITPAIINGRLRPGGGWTACDISFHLSPPTACGAPSASNGLRDDS